MRFKVTWSQTARDKLARLYLAASDRRRFSETANEIDRILERAPIAKGEHVIGNRRALAERPLVVVYDVFLDDKKVLVVDVKSFNPEM